MATITDTIFSDSMCAQSTYVTSIGRVLGTCASTASESTFVTAVWVDAHPSRQYVGYYATSAMIGFCWSSSLSTCNTALDASDPESSYPYSDNATMFCSEYVQLQQAINHQCLSSWPSGDAFDFNGVTDSRVEVNLTYAPPSAPPPQINCLHTTASPAAAPTYAWKWTSNGIYFAGQLCSSRAGFACSIQVNSSGTRGVALPLGIGSCEKHTPPFFSGTRYPSPSAGSPWYPHAQS